MERGAGNGSEHHLKLSVVVCDDLNEDRYTLARMIQRYADGVLTVKIPKAKKPEDEVKKISIE